MLSSFYRLFACVLIVSLSFPSIAAKKSRHHESCLRRAATKVASVARSSLRGVVLGASAAGFWNVGSSIDKQDSFGEALELKMQNIAVAAAAGASIGFFYSLAQSTFGLGLRDMADILSRYANLKIPVAEDSESDEEEEETRLQVQRKKKSTK